MTNILENLHINQHQPDFQIGRRHPVDISPADTGLPFGVRLRTQEGTWVLTLTGLTKPVRDSIVLADRLRYFAVPLDLLETIYGDTPTIPKVYQALKEYDHDQGSGKQLAEQLKAGILQPSVTIPKDQTMVLIAKDVRGDEIDRSHAADVTPRLIIYPDGRLRTSNTERMILVSPDQSVGTFLNPLTKDVNCLILTDQGQPQIGVNVLELLDLKLPPGVTLNLSILRVEQNEEQAHYALVLNRTQLRHPDPEFPQRIQRHIAGGILQDDGYKFQYHLLAEDPQAQLVVQMNPGTYYIQAAPGSDLEQDLLTLQMITDPRSGRRLLVYYSGTDCGTYQNGRLVYQAGLRSLTRQAENKTVSPDNASSLVQRLQEAAAFFGVTPDQIIKARATAAQINYLANPFSIQVK